MSIDDKFDDMCVWRASYESGGSTFIELSDPQKRYKMKDHPLYNCTNCSGTQYSKYNQKRLKETGEECYTAIKGRQ